MNGSCACGAVQFTTPAPKPSMLFHCHCIDCRKQSSSAFGTSAIFPYFKVDDDPSITFFVRDCDTGNQQRCYFCKQCGSRIIHEYILPDGRKPDTVTVKGGLLEGLDWSGAIHLFCRSAVYQITEGAQMFDGEPEFAEEKQTQS